MMFKILNGREHFWQWDTGQKLIVDGDICSEVHFCNGTSDCSLICEVRDGTVDVPNILLQEAKSIKAYAYVCGEDNQYTECVQMFLVMPRTKPDDYVYTETEVKCYEALNRRLNELEEKGISAETVKNAVEGYLAENSVFETDETLTYENGILSVNTTNQAEEDNTKPITSSGVHTIVGNIGAILDTS